MAGIVHKVIAPGPQKRLNFFRGAFTFGGKQLSHFRQSVFGFFRSLWAAGPFFEQAVAEIIGAAK
jgi:hypothetical protein